MNRDAVAVSPPRLAALAPFQVRSFRFQWPADLLTSWAFEMETLILGWYILVETGSVLLLTLFASLQYIGTLVAPILGMVGDRVGHRAVLLALRASYASFAVILMALALAGALNPLYVLIIVAFNGLLRPSDQGVRSALTAHTVPPQLLIGAMSFARTTQDSARIAGALAGAGLFAAFGMGPSYVAITVLYAVSTLLTLGVAGAQAEHLDPVPHASPWRDLKEGIAHVWTTPSLLAAIWLAFLFNLTAFPLSGGLLPFVAKDIYGLDQTGLGYLVAGFATGALFGSLALSRSSGANLSRMMIVAALGWYVLLLGFAQTTHAVAGFVWLVLAGFVQSLSVIPVTIVLMRDSAERFRGRVMGVRMLAIYSLPFGLLAAGVLIERIGFGATATAYATFGLIFTLFIAVRWRDALWHPPRR